MALHEQLHAAAELFGDKVALVCDDHRFTYAELAGMADSVSALLQAHGVGAGDRVAVCLPNSVEAVVAIYGVWGAGGCIVMADADSTADNLAYRIEHSGATVLIAHAGRSETVRTALTTLQSASRRPVVLFAPGSNPDQLQPDDISLMSGDARAVAQVDRNPHGPAAIIYTSGSTGRPKGVTHSQHSIETVVATVGDYLQHSPDDVVLCVLQLAFGYGLLQMLVTFDHGGRLVLRRGFGLPFDILNTLSAEGVTGLACVPTLVALLRQLSDASLAQASSLRYVTNAAAALAPAQVAGIREAFPSAQLFLMHGQTECLRTTYLAPEELPLRPTSVGRGMAGVDLWLEAADGTRPPHPGEGELVVRGDNVMLGYWLDPEATARVVSPGRTPHERVLRTGDIFRTDAEGFLHFVTRCDDIIKSRGEKVSPHEVEQVLAQRPEILEARVLGVPDDLLGQAVRAEIVLHPGMSLSLAELRRFLRRVLEAHKVPAQIVFVDSLPKSANGKILRTL